MVRVSLQYHFADFSGQLPGFPQRHGRRQPARRLGLGRRGTRRGRQEEGQVETKAEADWWRRRGSCEVGEGRSRGAEAGPGGLKMASKVPARLNSSMMTYFRASCEQEPVVMFSCVLGGIGEAAPFSLFHPHQHQHKWHAPALPASTPRGPSLFQSTTKAPRTQSLPALCWKGGTHMRIHA